MPSINLTFSDAEWAELEAASLREGKDGGTTAFIRRAALAAAVSVVTATRPRPKPRTRKKTTPKKA